MAKGGKGVESLRKTKAFFDFVFNTAENSGIIEINPAPRTLLGILTPHKTENYKAIIQPSEIAELIRAINTSQAHPSRINALFFTMLTALRSHNVLKAKWEHIKEIKGIWALEYEPSEMKKSPRGFTIPLNKKALEIIEKQRQISKFDSPYIFNIRENGENIRKTTLDNLLTELGLKGRHTLHGFRAMFSTICYENEKPSEVIELCLAHEIGSSVSRAYNRSSRLENKAELMQWYCDYLESLEPIKIRGAI